MIALINAEMIQGEKNRMPLAFKEAHLYNGYMSKFLPYGTKIYVKLL